MLETEDDFTGVEADLILEERAMLWQVVVEVAAVHQVQDEAQLVGRLKRVRHAYNERTSLLDRQTLTLIPSSQLEEQSHLWLDHTTG